MQCERCGWKRSSMNRSYMIIEHAMFCEICLHTIVKEWLIKKQEVTMLGSARTACEVNSCTYEIGHYGKHSWDEVQGNPWKAGPGF